MFYQFGLSSIRRVFVLLIALLVLFANNTYCFADSSPRKPGSPTSAKASVVAPKIKAVLPAKPKPGSKLSLWKVTSESGATLYLLGTVHVFKPEFYPLPEEMEKAFNKSRALIVEVNMTKSDPTLTQNVLRQKGLYSPADDISKHIDADTDKQLQKYCTLNKVPYQSMVRFKPWAVAIQILALELARLGYNPKEGIDLHFMNEANAVGKKIIGLETEEFQLNLFADFDPELQAKWLKVGLVDLESLPKDADELMKAWREGDDKAMEEITTRDLRENPDLMPIQEKMLYERNITMAQKLELYLKGNDTFLAAIGSGHLAGDRSVIELLKQKGYKITQVVVGEQI